MSTSYLIFDLVSTLNLGEVWDHDFKSYDKTSINDKVRYLNKKFVNKALYEAKCKIQKLQVWSNIMHKKKKEWRILFLLFILH
jgi:hypothetical protein